MLSWTGSRNTAPDTLTGEVTIEMSRPARKPVSPVCQLTRSR
jgi:hypothetical protein